MAFNVNDGGTWKQPSPTYINNGGTWKEPKGIYINDGGTWKPVYRCNQGLKSEAQSNDCPKGGSFSILGSCDGSCTSNVSCCSNSAVALKMVCRNDDGNSASVLTRYENLSNFNTMDIVIDYVKFEIETSSRFKIDGITIIHITHDDYLNGDTNFTIDISGYTGDKELSGSVQSEWKEQEIAICQCSLRMY